MFINHEHGQGGQILVLVMGRVGMACCGAQIADVAVWWLWVDLFVEKSKAYGDCHGLGARCGFQMGEDSTEMSIDTI